MQNLISRLLICLTITATQAVYLAASADTTEKPEMVALAQPAAAQMTTCKNAIREETRLVEINNQFIPGITIYAANFGSDEAARLAKDGVFIGTATNNHYIDLQGGNVLLNPEQDIIVGTRLGKIFIGAGANVFVVNAGPDIVVYDLLQTKPKQVQVSVTTNKHRLSLEPGRMIVLTEQNIKDFEKLEIDCHRVAYRNAQGLDSNGQNGPVKAFAADFSIASAMVTIQPLKRLTVSANRQDKATVERLVKGAVLLGDFATGAEQAIVTDSPTTTVQIADPIEVASGNRQ